MNLMFYGLLLMNLNFTLNIGNYVLNLLPTFAGILLLVKGMRQFASQSRNFTDARNPALLAAAYSAVVWLMDLAGVTSTLPEIVSLALGIITTLINVFLAYVVVVGMKELEEAVHSDLNTDYLKMFWIILFLVNVGIYVGLIIPALALMCIVFQFLLSILFLRAFYKGAKKYNKAVYGVEVLNVTK